MVVTKGPEFESPAEVARPGPPGRAGGDVDRGLVRLRGARIAVLRPGGRAARAPDRRGGGQPLRPGGSSWSAGPRTTDGAAARVLRGRAVGLGLDGPARELANDQELRPAGILPGDPSLYPRSLADLYGPAATGDGPDRARRLDAELAAHGIAAGLPSGFEGRIFVRPAAGGERGLPGGPLRHLRPAADVGDFGGGAVDRHGAERHVLPSCSSTGPRASARPSSPARGCPGSLAPGDFRPMLLRRGLARPVGHPVVLHRGRTAVHLLRRPRQPRPARPARAPGERAPLRASRWLRPPSRDRRRERRGTDRPLPGRLLPCWWWPGWPRLSGPTTRPGPWRQARAADLAARPLVVRWSGWGPGPRPPSGWRPSSSLARSPAGLVAASYVAFAGCVAVARPAGCAPGQLRVLRHARHAAPTGAPRRLDAGPRRGRRRRWPSPPPAGRTGSRCCCPATWPGTWRCSAWSAVGACLAGWPRGPHAPWRGPPLAAARRAGHPAVSLADALVERAVGFLESRLSRRSFVNRSRLRGQRRGRRVGARPGAAARHRLRR